MQWLASIFAALMLFFSSLFGSGAQQAPTPAATTTSPAIPHNATLVKSGEDYVLYLVADDASTSGQYMIVDPATGAQTLLGEPFAASGADLVGFYAQSVSRVLDKYGKYVAFDTGTSVERMYAVYAIADGHEIVSFCAQHEPLFWNDAMVYLACDHSNLDTAFEGGAPDIATANLLTGATTTVVAARQPDGSRFSYQIVRLSGSMLTYRATPLKRDAHGVWDLSTSTPTEQTIDLAGLAR